MLAIKLPRGLLHRLFRIQRGMTLGVRAMVSDGDGRVLLVRHTYSAGWNFPGGGVERGEEALTALRRELVEEAGIRLLRDPELFGVYSNEKIFRGDHILFYLARDFARDGFVPTAEIADARFFAADEMPPDATGGTLRRIAEVRDGKSLAGHW
ncbi:MAG: NUDIX domain-containing protein [Pseudomonadota bacterium]|nr:NUDIX domain-containing protein [Pseudomonadota bacterium]